MRLSSFAVLTLGVWLTAAAPSPGDKKAAVERAELKGADGKKVGEVTFEEAAKGVVIYLDLTDVPAGTHAIHLHNAGRCEMPGFKSAGDHLNPEKHQHGIANPQGQHVGDLPNIHVGEEGKLKVELFAPGLTLGAGANGLKDADGTAIVIHAGADDYRSDPAGGAGDRIACGAIGGK